MRKTIYWTLGIISLICLCVIIDILIPELPKIETENYQEKNAVIISICTSIITGILVYIISTVPPLLYKRDKFLEISNIYIRDILIYMKKSEAYLKYKHSVNDLKYITNLPIGIQLNKRIYISWQEESKKRDVNRYESKQSEIDFWLEEKDLVCKNIDVLFAHKYSETLPENVYEVLSNLRYCMFYFAVTPNYTHRINFKKEYEDYINIVSSFKDTVVKTYSNLIEEDTIFTF